MSFKKHLYRLSLYIWKHWPLPNSIRRLITVSTNPSFLGSVQGIIFNDKDEVLLLYHTYRHTPWGVPGGWMKHESPAQCLEREVKEETGFNIKFDKIIDVSYVMNIYKVHVINFIIIARIKDGEFRPSPEISDYRFCDLQHLPERMFDEQKEMLDRFLSEEAVYGRIEIPDMW